MERLFGRVIGVFIILFSLLSLSGCESGSFSVDKTVSGWQVKAEDKYFYDDGAIQTGLVEIEGETYYFDIEGKMQVGYHTIGNQGYYFNEEGIMQKRDDLVEALSEDSTTDTNQDQDEDRIEGEEESSTIGKKTGYEKLDQEIDNILDSLMISETATDVEKLSAVYDWMNNNFRYRGSVVDLSNGYTEDLVAQLAEHFVLRRNGSCEHYAATLYVFFERLGYESIMVEGDFLSDDRTHWVEHAWIMTKVGDQYYHFDGLYGRNHTWDPHSFFMKKDEEIEDVHRWDRSKYPESN